MRHEQTFEIGVPVATGHRLWRRFSDARETPIGGQVRFEPVGEDRTRVRLAMELEPETVEKTVREFVRYVESQRNEEAGDDGPRDSVGGDLSRAPGSTSMPLVGKPPG